MIYLNNLWRDKMDNKFDKIIIGIIVGLFVLYIYYSNRSNNSDMYHIESKLYKVCNENIYITDYTYNNTLDVQEMLNEIECLCNNNC